MFKSRGSTSATTARTNHAWRTILGGVCALSMLVACGRRADRWGTADQDGAAYAKTAAAVPGKDDVIVNELHVMPSSDTDGDGRVDPIGDEFIELVNVSGRTLDLSGVVVLDSEAPRHTFPAGTTLLPGGVIVVFGSAAPLSLNDEGDAVRIAAPSGDSIFQVGYTSADVVVGISLTNPRDAFPISSPATATSDFLRHDRVPGAHDSNSPGTSVEGLPLR